MQTSVYIETTGADRFAVRGRPTKAPGVMITLERIGAPSDAVVALFLDPLSAIQLEQALAEYRAKHTNISTIAVRTGSDDPRGAA